MTQPMTFTLIGGPTVAFDYAGLRFLTDPTFDAPGPNGNLVKLEGPAVPSDSIGRVDVVLLSHDEHEDNLDVSGRAMLSGAGLVLTTPEGGKRLDFAQGMARWDSLSVEGADAAVTITAVAARHGTSAVKHLAGQVTGFVLEADGWPTVYVSGDNASVAKARKVSERFPDVAVAVLFAGGAKAASIGDVLLTLDAERSAQVAGLWPSASIVPVHIDDWAHFTEPREAFLENFAHFSDGERLAVLERGVPREVAPQ
ncbi:MBL fold metallo-hydrolase [Demequina oxidasica]|uniref:MBL fold metallo-hydrolase n=1 Tax=Demequina oxidasica TaxID=676199 RepID=UPI0007814321|nr:MBL fold metallo-hydrolase [Demequina oxidasica]